MRIITNNIITLTRFTSTPIESEDEVLERAEMMDFLMDMAKHENDIVLVFSNSIADRIEEFENKMEMPSVPVPERINSLMKIKGLTQSDLKEVATQMISSFRYRQLPAITSLGQLPLTPINSYLCNLYCIISLSSVNSLYQIYYTKGKVMKPFTASTHGRDHYFHGPKEHTVPKSSKDRRCTRSAKRQENSAIIRSELRDA